MSTSQAVRIAAAELYRELPEFRLMRQVTIIRAIDGLRIVTVRTDADLSIVRKLSDILPAGEIWQLQNCGMCVDSDTLVRVEA